MLVAEQLKQMVQGVIDRRGVRLAGHEVLQAPTGTKGIEALAKERVDLVACDIHLPGMDGYDVLREIRARPDLAGTRVVAVTASAMVGDREEMLKAGFDGYISKPIDPQTFVGQLEAFIAPPPSPRGGV
jgi:two-component system cell cycle response regulator